MLKMQIIGHIGKDAIIHQHGVENCVNFSVAHTDKFKDARGVLNERTVWVNCAWWLDSQSPVIQYLKKGTQVYIEGFPEAKMWDGNDGKKNCGLNLRVGHLTLVGGKREDNTQNQQPTQQAPQPSANAGFVPYNSDEPPF